MKIINVYLHGFGLVTRHVTHFSEDGWIYPAISEKEWPVKTAVESAAESTVVDETVFDVHVSIGGKVINVSAYYKVGTAVLYQPTLTRPNLFKIKGPQLFKKILLLKGFEL